MHDSASRKEEAPTDASENAPGKLLDALIGLVGVNDDVALADALQVAPTLITEIRSARTPVSDLTLSRMNDISRLTLGNLRSLMADRREKFTLS